jgi:hypothetical protein
MILKYVYNDCYLFTFFFEFAVSLDVGTIVKLSKDNLSDTWFNKYD